MPSATHARNQGSRRDPKLTHRRLLLIRPGAIGDTIVSLPALEHLRRQSEYCEVWVSGRCVPLIQFADTVRSMASTGLDLLELGLTTRASELLRDFDQIISWYGSTRSEFREAVRDLPVQFLPALPRDGEGTHAVDWYLDQVGAPQGAVPFIAPPALASRDFIACHPFSGSPRKNWAAQKVQELAERTPVPLEFCAGPDDPALPGGHRFPDLLQVAAWLRSAKAYVGNDSGISHLAAAVSIPSVVIFRCTDPNVWAPRGHARVDVVAGDPTVDEIQARLDSLT